jgi:hypothetical protein
MLIRFLDMVARIAINAISSTNRGETLI